MAHIPVPRLFLKKAALPATAAAAALVIISLSLLGHSVKAPVLPELPKTMQPHLPQPAPTPVPAPSPGLFAAAPSWQQDFSKQPGGAVDQRVWQFEIGGDGWGNNQAQYYTNRTQNARIEDGHLVVQAQREDYNGNQYTSARLITRAAFQPQYGKLVFHDVRLPRGAGTWPALWLWPSGSKYSQAQIKGNGEAGLRNGEIDIMEYVGASPGEINSSAHSFANYPNHKERSGQTAVDDTTAHDYSLEWTPESLTFTVDNNPYYVVHNPHTGPASWPYDQPYFLIINLAMGGDWGGMASDQYPPLGIDGNGPWRLSIGSISYYPLAGQ